MKIIPKRASDAGTDTVTVLSRVVQSPSPAKPGIDVAEMRDRIKILDALEKEGTTVLLDDKLHKRLCQLITDFQFGMASRELMVVLEDVLSAGDAKPDGETQQ